MMNYRILICVLVVIILVGVIFSLAVRSYIHIYNTEWVGILSSEKVHSANKKKIFLIGSSGIYPINATKVNEYFLENGINYELFNLADVADNPKKRSASIHNIIQNKPDIVIYGLGALEFEKSSQSSHSLLDYITSPRKIIEKIFGELVKPVIEDIQTSPRDRSLILIKYVLRGPDQKYHPFVKFVNTEINELHADVEINHKLDLSEDNENLYYLRKIVNELQNDQIKVIIMTNPYNEIAYQRISEADLNEFEQTLDRYAKEFDLDLYFLHTKYSHMNIWRDVHHVAVHPDAAIYTQDVLRIILKELE